MSFRYAKIIGYFKAQRKQYQEYRSPATNAESMDGIDKFLRS